MRKLNIIFSLILLIKLCPGFIRIHLGLFSHVHSTSFVLDMLSKHVFRSPLEHWRGGWGEAGVPSCVKGENVLERKDCSDVYFSLNAVFMRIRLGDILAQLLLSDDSKDPGWLCVHRGCRMRSGGTEIAMCLLQALGSSSAK